MARGEHEDADRAYLIASELRYSVKGRFSQRNQKKKHLNMYVVLFMCTFLCLVRGVARRRARTEDIVPRRSRATTPTSVVDFLFLRHYFIYS